MRVLNPNYLWTCDPYTADHNYMLSKTFEMCDPVVDDRKLDALFCGILCTSPPDSPISRASEASGNESQDIFCTRDVDIKGIIDDCNPAAKALAEMQVTLPLDNYQPGTDVSRVDASKLSPPPVNEQNPCLPTVTRFVEVLSADSRAIHGATSDGPCFESPVVPSSAIRVAPAPISALIQGEGNVTGMTAAQAALTTTTSTPAPSKNNKRQHELQFGFTSSSEAPQTPTVGPVIHSERLTSRTPVTVDQFLAENTGKRKRNSNGVIEPTEKKRRVGNKGKKVSPAVVDAVHPPLPSSSLIPSSDSQNLPVQRRRRARKSIKAKPEVIDVDQEPLPPHQRPSTAIPRQLIPASMRPAPVSSVQSMPSLSPGDGFSMPLTHTSFPSSVAQSGPAPGSQATALPFNTVLPNNLGYGIPGVGYAESLGMPPGTFDQVSSYSAQYLERQRALLLYQQMQAQLQQARSANQTVGTSFFDPRFAPNGTMLAPTTTSSIWSHHGPGSTMPPMLAPTTTTPTNNSIWSHHGTGPSRPFFQNPSLVQSQVMEPFDTFGVNWTPPVQTTTRTHPPNCYP